LSKLIKNEGECRIIWYQPAQIWNFDEVRIYFEPNFSRTMEKGENKNVAILSVGARNMRMTIILCISASGEMAPPVLLYFNKTFKKFELQSHPEILITSNQPAYNLESTHYSEVLPHFFKFIKSGSLVVYDESTAHYSARIDKLFESYNIEYIKIPGGATCLCQPIDFGIGKKVKNEVKHQYMKWLDSNFDNITTPEGRRKKSFKKPTTFNSVEVLYHNVLYFLWVYLYKLPKILC